MDSGAAQGHTPQTQISQSLAGHRPVQIRLEKFDHQEGQHRYCVLHLSRTLFGEWCVEQTSGPLGEAGGQQRRSYYASQEIALAAAAQQRDRQIKRGFVPIPVQLGLF
ncbi:MULTISPECIES: WGR domain-containing protein [Phaeobacter]